MFFWVGLPHCPAQESVSSTNLTFRQFCERDYLLGDWFGLRTELADHGVNFEFLYGGSVPDNLSGGNRRGAVYQGALLMDLNLDSEKLIGYEGGTFNVSANPR